MVQLSIFRDLSGAFDVAAASGVPIPSTPACENVCRVNTSIVQNDVEQMSHMFFCTFMVAHRALLVPLPDKDAMSCNAGCAWRKRAMQCNGWSWQL